CQQHGPQGNERGDEADDEAGDPGAAQKERQDQEEAEEPQEQAGQQEPGQPRGTAAAPDCGEVRRKDRLEPAPVVGRRLPVVLRLDMPQSRRVGLLRQRPPAVGGVAGAVWPRPRLIRRHEPEPMSV
ncbi:MAG TPA: hypothetical protein VF885_04795, partial [Arthrobacter sp.]